MKTKKIIRRILILLVLLVGWIAAEVWLAHRVTPPPTVRTFTQFMKWHPQNSNYFLHESEGRPYVEVLGQNGGVLPSGPAAYVFDESGRMVHYSRDSGDDSKYQQRWRNGELREITRDEAERIMGAAAFEKIPELPAR